MLSEQAHFEILNKFHSLRGTIFNDRKQIIGLPPDELVSEYHHLHSLQRGLYKPEKQRYILSCKVTDEEENYGLQISWRNDEKTEFNSIRLAPPDKEGDVQKEKDIFAMRNNIENSIPLGIIYKIEAGKYLCLGLGICTAERSDGTFIIKPYNPLKIKDALNLTSDIPESLITEFISTSKKRIGQDKFRKSLLERSSRCEICGISAIHTRASHVKPWAVAENDERLDVENGLLLCPNHDHLFDKGYISFNKKGIMLISDELTDTDKILFNLNDQKEFKFTAKQKEYLDYHRKNIFKK